MRGPVQSDNYRKVKLCSIHWYARVCVRALTHVGTQRVAVTTDRSSYCTVPLLPVGRGGGGEGGLDCGGQGAVVDERRRGRLDEETKHAIKTLITLK